MTKREILDWIESQWQQTVNKYREDSEKKERAYLDEYFVKSGLRETAGQIQRHLEQAVQLWLDWKQAQKTDEHLRFHDNYRCLEHALDCFTLKEGAVYGHFLKHEIDLRTTDLEQLLSDRNDTEGKIRHNYYQLKQLVTVSKTTKDAMEYLEKLGFDLSDLCGEKVAEKIDTTFLFPGEAA